MTANDPEHFDPATMRVIDAAINRAAEGLRVVEDYARMILDDAHLTERLKRLRHSITEAVGPFNSTDRIFSRDTQHDVGTAIATDSEFVRDSTHGIIQANMARVSQSLRTIEEYAKTLAPEVARRLEPLRYESYSLEKAMLTTVLSLGHLQRAHVYLLTDGLESVDRFRELLAAVIRGGVDLIQLRDQKLNDRELLERGRVLGEVCRPAGVKWIMNNRADLCVAAGADGVHLGQSDLPVHLARRIVGPAKLIGVSTHSMEQARRAVIDGANYVGVGPVFPSRTKDFEAYVGVELIRNVAAEIRLPAFAIGGIDQGNVDQIAKAGMPRVAIQSAVTSATNPETATRGLRRALSSK
jgi:thiamine-phosphate pyrophosphorylase